MSKQQLRIYRDLEYCLRTNYIFSKKQVDYMNFTRDYEY